jgi:hypothetical protein
MRFAPAFATHHSAEALHRLTSAVEILERDGSPAMVALGVLNEVVENY